MNLNKMILSKNIVPQLHTKNNLEVPADSIFNLPEKVLQFGTGVLLRGLPNYFIDKANKQFLFNGRVVVIKSTSNGGTDEFSNQNNLFTHCINGKSNGNIIEEKLINASISRVLHASSQWQEILNCAANPDIQIIISNTTEMGIVLVEESPETLIPTSFPGKLLAVLFERFNKLGNNLESGMTIIPTELIENNATKLKAIVNQLAINNNFGKDFINWLNTANDFCNSLVDRIVPGKMESIKHSEMEDQLGYKDGLMIMSEPYSLWAIETNNQISINRLSFAKADAGVVIAPDINKYRELKLRLLNGTHSFCCGLAYLNGFVTVADAMKNSFFYGFVKKIMLQEIAPCIIGKYNISEAEATAFSLAVLDRFSNPNIQHKWLSISVQYTSKIKMRNVPLLQQYFAKENNAPNLMSASFAAYLLFAKPVKNYDNKYFGIKSGIEYYLEDDFAQWHYQNWQANTTENAILYALKNTEIWGVDLTTIPNFYETVLAYFKNFEKGDFSFLSH